MSQYEDQLKILAGKEAEHKAKLAELRVLDQREHMRPSNRYDVYTLWSQTLCSYVTFRKNVAAKGDTPEMAKDNFDHLWTTGEGRVDLPDDFDDDDFDFD